MNEKIGTQCIAPLFLLQQIKRYGFAYNQSKLFQYREKSKKILTKYLIVSYFCLRNSYVADNRAANLGLHLI